MKNLITTINGPMDESLLERKDHFVDNDNEHTEATEYWHKGELVHRSVHVTLKQAGVIANILSGAF